MDLLLHGRGDDLDRDQRHGLVGTEGVPDADGDVELSAIGRDGDPLGLVLVGPTWAFGMS